MDIFYHWLLSFIPYENTYNLDWFQYILYVIYMILIWPLAKSIIHIYFIGNIQYMPQLIVNIFVYLQPYINYLLVIVGVTEIIFQYHNFNIVPTLGSSLGLILAFLMILRMVTVYIFSILLYILIMIKSLFLDNFGVLLLIVIIGTAVTFQAVAGFFQISTWLT